MESEFELTQLWETDMIVQFPKISAIYYGLLQAGYDFYIPERSAEHIRHIMKYRNRKHQDTFFSGAKQDTCDVYPYWPRAFMMESASFFLNDNNTLINSRVLTFMCHLVILKNTSERFTNKL